MVCYTLPLATAIALLVIERKYRQKIANIGLLTKMLWGGAIMLAVDHLWNGELFLIGENVALDLALGVTMTVAVIGIWAVIALVAKIKDLKRARTT